VGHMLRDPVISGRDNSHLHAHLQAHLRLTGGAAVSWYTGRWMVPPSESRPLIVHINRLPMVKP
jgi:hypothetical protein